MNPERNLGRQIPTLWQLSRLGEKCQGEGEGESEEGGEVAVVQMGPFWKKQMSSKTIKKIAIVRSPK